MSDQRITVLLVDDQPFVGVVVKNLLAGEPDIELHCCDKALDAMAQANQINPTIILQDLVLPGIDGLTLVRMYRENPATASTPIVVLSGNDDESDARAGDRRRRERLPRQVADEAGSRRVYSPSRAACSEQRERACPEPRRRNRPEPRSGRDARSQGDRRVPSRSGVQTSRGA